MTENFPGPMAGKTALVTGGTGGIGRATAAGLAALGARVGITGRDKARTQAAATGIVRESGNPAVDAFAAEQRNDVTGQRLDRHRAAGVGGAPVALELHRDHLPARRQGLEQRPETEIDSQQATVEQHD